MGRLLNLFYVISTLTSVMALVPASAHAQSQLANQQPAATPAQALVQNTAGAGPQLQMEFLGCPQGYAVNSSPVQFMCVVKNTSSAPVAAGAYRIQCVPLDGLDFFTGDTLPVLPALQPLQQAYVLWQLKPRDDGHPYAATAILQQLATAPGQSITPVGVRIAVFPTLPTQAHFGTPIAGLAKSPQAGYSTNTAWLAANLIAMKVRPLSNREPLALLAAASGGQWQTYSIASPLIELSSAKPGQQPWHQTFRWLTSAASSSNSQATLTLNGTCGKLWTVRLTMTALVNSSTIRADLLLTAINDASLESVQFPVLRPYNLALPAADGTVHLLAQATEQLPAASNITALHVGTGVCGETWPTMSPIPGWQWRRVATLGGLQSAGSWFSTQPTTIPAGNSVEFKFRLFVHPLATSLLNALAYQEH